MTNPPIREFPSCAPKDIEHLKDDDILVAVGGEALTKGDFGLAMRRYWWSLERDKMMKPEERSRRYKMYGKSYLSQFITTQLLVQEARKQRLMSASNIVARVGAALKRSVRQYGMPSKALDRSIPGGIDGLKRSLEDMCWYSSYIASNVTPRATVADYSMVSNVIEQFEAENAAAEATNKMRRAALDVLRKRIVEGGEDFGKLADENGMDESQRKGAGGYWRSFRTSVEREPVFVEKIYPLPVGGVSEVLEDDDGYYIVKVLDIEQLPIPTNAPAVYNPPKDYSLGRIFLQKEELTNVMGGPREIRQQLQAQFQQEVMKQDLEKLAAVASIVYPYGTNLFLRAKSGDRKGAAKKKLSKRERRALREAKIVKKALAAGEDPKAALKKARRAAQKSKRGGNGNKPAPKGRNKDSKKTKEAK